MRVFTICTQSYLAFAGVLAESLARTHDGLRLSVVLIDGDESTTLDFADVILPWQLPLGDPGEFRRMAAIYDVVELSTALKPWAFQYLFARQDESNGEPVLYLDPDIRVYAPLDDIGELAAQHGIVLNPHTTAPLPRDDRMPTERDLLRAGTYNLGFLGVGTSAGAFLDWWAERLRRDCINAVDEGLFVDQRWIDLVPSYFAHYVLRDPGSNVAYWNLPNRRVENGNGTYRVDGVPLRFFHFSGFDADTPQLLSKHQGDNPRVSLADQPALDALCADYAKQLKRHGHSRYAKIAYRYDHAANGMHLGRTIRRAYRRELVRQESEGITPTLPDPFTPEGAEQLVEFLRAPVAADAPALSRYFDEVRRERPDLRMAFPDIPGKDTGRFASWVADQIPDEMLPGTRAQLERGVNLYGYVFAESGTGQIGRAVVAALQAAEIPYAVIPFRETINRQQHSFASDTNTQAIYDTNLICVNADQVPVFLEKMGPEILDRRCNIGVWAWEVDDMPAAMAKSAEYLHEVWGISEYTAAGLRRVLRTEVRAFPLPVVVPEPVVRSRAELGLAEGFLALFCFDFESVFERKNPLAVIDAFRRAFPLGGVRPARLAEGTTAPHLVIKSVNGDRHPAELARLRESAGSDITIIDGYRAAEEQMALMNACDVYVSLHRAEGFGLTVAEAMALGKPVISTAWSSTLELTTEENSYLVPAQVISVPKGTPAYPSTAHWAEPDVDAAAVLLRRVFEKRSEAGAKGQRARRDIAERYSPAARAPMLRELLDAARRAYRDRGPHARFRGPIGAPSTTVLAADERAARLMSRPDPALPSRMPWLAGLWRRIMLRLIRNYWVHQREVDRALLDAVRSSRESVRLELAALADATAKKLEELEERVDRE
jgi:glycosyltransferase involved in cell wall biosynthesis